MKEVCLISCTKTKLDKAAQPKDLYMKSDLFKKKREYCELYHDDWYILSAKYHLLDPEGKPIPPYNKMLRGASAKEKRVWSKKVFAELEKEGLLSEKLIIHAGINYYKYLLPLLEERGVAYEIPTKGLGFGEKKAWYKSQIDKI